MLVLDLPIPGRAAHPNSRSRSHWPKTRAVKKQRQAVAEAAKIASIEQLTGPPFWARVRVRAVFHTRTGRRQDADNLVAWLKSTFDGLEDAGIVANDRGLVCEPPEVKKTGRLAEWLELKVEPEP